MLLFGLFGWKTALLYVSTGLVIAIIAGLGHRPLEAGAVRRGLGLRDQGRRARAPRTAGRRSPSASRPGSPPSRTSSARSGRTSSAASPSAPPSTATCRRTSWPRSWASRAWWSVPLAVLIGIPLYSNAAGIIPIVQALLEKGAALGHRAGLHDVGHRPVAAGDDHPEESAEAPLDPHLRRRRRDGDHDRRVPVQPRLLTQASRQPAEAPAQPQQEFFSASADPRSFSARSPFPARPPPRNRRSRGFS
ncbi:MAG: hypothetical protein M0C28_12450 [Candidatus Moduliflexus flocculans]|nr:hypothetical protein [Candidatus Moduliflexus flocculans]